MPTANDKDELLQRLNLLEANEERYELALSGSQIGWWDWQVDTDHFVLSPFFKSLLGYMEQDFPNSKLFFEQKMHQDDRNNFENAIAKHLDNQVPFDVEFRIMLKSGRYDIFRACGRTQWDSEGLQSRMVGTIINITEQRKLEKRVAVQSAITQTLTESRSLAGLSDVAGRLLESICLGFDWEFGAIWVPKYGVLHCVGTFRKPNFNDGIEFENTSKLMTFTSGAGLPGRVYATGEVTNFPDIAQENSMARLPAAQRAGLRAAFGFPITLEYLIVGVVEIFTREPVVIDRPLHNLMSATGFQIGQYIYQKEIENELHESEAYKTAILESVSDSIVTIDKNGKIDTFNSRTSRMFGFDKSELTDFNINKLIKGLNGDIPHLAGQPIAEYEGVHHDGTSFPVELTVSEMQEDQRGRFAVTISDITERKKLERAKKEFISVVSHELRTPLTSISGSITLLLGHFNDQISARAQQMLEIANNNCERLIRIINDILDVEKIEAGKMTFKFARINMKKLIEDAVDLNEGFAKKYEVSIAITKEEDAWVNGDYDRLIQVMTNLLSNAIKFSVKHEQVLVALTNTKGAIKVVVTNKGEGIPEKFQSEIFGKFAQADASSTRKAGGTGLGLSISKAIVEHHGGNIGFISTPKEKVEFFFQLPEDNGEHNEPNDA